MSRIALFATGVMAALTAAGALASSTGTASAGGYGYGPAYGGYPQPCCNYAPPPPPPPCCAAPYYAPAPYYPPYQVAPVPRAPLPPPPLIGAEGPKYYSGVGHGPVAPPCYRQNVRVPDRYGGWTWGVKHGCDAN